MNLFDKLKQLKLIEPDASFTERSRRDILATPQPIFPVGGLTPWRVFVRIFEVGVAGGLVALFILIMTSGIANSPLTPVPFSAVNPDALHAEAQAVDIQIQLARLAYEASRATGTAAESTIVSHAAMSPMAIANTASSTTSTATTTLSVEDVLRTLSN